MRMTAKVKPRGLFETHALDDEIIAFPPSDRIAHETRVGILRQLSPIHEDLTIGEVFIQHHYHGRGLDDLCPADRSTAGDVSRPERQTPDGTRIVLTKLGHV